MTESASRLDMHHRVVLPVLIVLTAVTGIVDAAVSSASARSSSL